MVEDRFKTNLREPLVILRAGLLAAVACLALAAYQISILNPQQPVLFASRKWTAAFSLAVVGIGLGLVILAASWTRWREPLAGWFRALLAGLGRLGRLNLLALPVLLVGYAYLLLGPQGYFFTDLPLRLSLFAWIVFLGAVFLKASGLVASWAGSLAFTWLLMGAGFQVATYLPQVSTYPFSLGWSEGSRFYYASLFFAEKLYSVAAQPSVLHPSRYLLQSIPFIIHGLPLWFHRLWQVFLWLAFSGGTAYLLAQRLQLGDLWLKTGYTLWAALFVLQGPVYYHLLVVALVVIWGFDSRRFWRSLVVVLIASAWAGISRVNWFPVAGLLAATIYFLETPVEQAGGESPGGRPAWKSWATYFIKPAAWFISGTLVAFGTQAAYIGWSGADPRLFTSSLTSDLLWYRLWPSPTYPLGIIPAIALVSAGVVAVLVAGLRGLHPARLLGIGAALGVLLVGGVVVSTKIGGGSNLHNLDAFLTFLAVTGGYVFFGRVAGQPAYDYASTSGRVLSAVILLVPVAFTLSAGGPESLPDPEQVASALTTLQRETSEAVEGGGEVLFISQRHLLTFDILEGIPLVEKYENVFLMEMAMGNNAYYLDSFYKDLADQRFALIVSDQQGNRLKGSEYPFGEENDVWVARVTQPMLESYQRKDVLKRFGIELLEPRP